MSSTSAFTQTAQKPQLQTSSISPAFLDNARQVAHKVVLDNPEKNFDINDFDAQPMQIRLPIEPNRQQMQTSKLPTNLFETPGDDENDEDRNPIEDEISEPQQQA